MTTTTETTKIGKGTKFHATIADGNPEWEVTRSRGRDVWEAKCLGLDFEGTVKVFTTEEIKRALAWKAAFQRNDDEGERFFAGLKLGQIVHYYNGFRNFVRCEVIRVNGKNLLQPIALVGEWRKMDLPRRNLDGTIEPGYYGKKIFNRTGAWQPSVGCVYEASERVRREHPVDPGTLPPISLTVPDLTPAEEETAAKHTKLNAIRKALDDYRADPDAQLARVKEILES